MRLEDNLKMCAQDLVFRQNVSCSPTVYSFQLRLAAMRGVMLQHMKNFVDPHSRDRDSSVYQSRIINSSLNSSLNSQDFPHLSIVYPMLKSGLAMIEMLAVSCNSPVKLEVNETVVDAFLTICKSIIDSKNLYLFSTWSPSPNPPTKNVQLQASRVYASSGSFPGIIVTDTSNEGDHSTQLHGKNGEKCWSPSTSTSPVSWSVKLSMPCVVVGVAVDWALPSQAMQLNAPVCAPKKLIIRVRREGYLEPFRTVMQLDLDEEKLHQNSWNHVYFFPHDSDAASIVEVQLQFQGGPCKANKDAQFKLYNVNVISKDVDAHWIDMIALTSKIQKSLFSFNGCLQHKSIEQASKHAFIALPRVTGSFGHLLQLLKHMWSPTSIIDHNYLTNEGVLIKDEDGVNAFQSLVDAVCAREDALRNEIGVLLSESVCATSVLKNVAFDTFHHSTGIQLLENGQVAESLDGRNNYAMLNCIMERGVWEWVVSLDKENHSDETTCIGIARCPLHNSNYDTSNDMWLVRCYNGDLYHGGRQGKRASVPSIHHNDICVFTYDAERQTLALSVNNQDCGVIFENVEQGGVSPVVAFYGSRKRTRFLRCKRMLSSKVTSRLNINQHPFGAAFPPRSKIQSLASIIRSTQHPHVLSSSRVLSAPNSLSTALLQSLANLADIQVHALYLRSITSFDLQGDKSDALEYPYVCEISSPVFELLLKNMETLVSDVDEMLLHTPDMNLIVNAIMSLKFTLRLLKAQFFFSKKFKAKITELYGPANSDKYVSIFNPLADVLRVLICGTAISNGQNIPESHDLALLRQLKSELSLLAGEVFAEGIPLLLHDSSDKVSLAQHVINMIFPCPSLASMENETLSSWVLSHPDTMNLADLKGQNNAAIFNVLKEIITQLSDEREIINTVDTTLESLSTQAVNYNNLVLHVLRLNAAKAFRRVEPLLISTEFGSFSNKSMGYLLDTDFQESLNRFLETVQEQLMIHITLKSKLSEPIHNFFVLYLDALCRYSEVLLRQHLITASDFDSTRTQGERDEGSNLPQTKVDSDLRSSIVGVSLSPVLHALCFVLRHNHLMAELLPSFVRLFQTISDVVQNCNFCKTTKLLIYEQLEAQGQCDPGHSDLCGLSKGWRNVKARFENSIDNSFTILEEGLLYSACSSDKTCAVVEIQGLYFPKSGLPSTSEYSSITKIGCNFVLEDDSQMDEASVFGVAMLPLKSRIYSDSPQLFMRRAYNGVFYRQGQVIVPSTDLVQQRLVHVGDRVRVEIDLECRTISYAVNDEALQIVFSNVPVGSLVPACGSYRSSVRIRLLNVEVMGTDMVSNVGVQNPISPVGKTLQNNKECLDKAILGKSSSSSVEDRSVISWNKNAQNYFSDEHSSLLAFSEGICKNISQYYPEDCVETWLTARADVGCGAGVHEWSFQILDIDMNQYHSTRESDGNQNLMAFGIVMGGHSLCVTQRLAGDATTASPTKRGYETPLSSKIISSNSRFSPGGLDLFSGSNSNVSQQADEQIFSPPVQRPRSHYQFSDILEANAMQDSGQHGDNEDGSGESCSSTSSRRNSHSYNNNNINSSRPDGVDIFTSEDEDDEHINEMCGGSEISHTVNDVLTHSAIPISVQADVVERCETVPPPPIARPALSRQSTPRGLVIPQNTTMFHFDVDDEEMEPIATSNCVSNPRIGVQESAFCHSSHALSLDVSCADGVDLDLSSSPLPPTSLPILSRTSTPSGIPVQNNTTMFNFEFDDDNLDDFNGAPSNLSPPIPIPTVPTHYSPRDAPNTGLPSPHTRLTAATLNELSPGLGSRRTGIVGIASSNGSRTSSLNSMDSRTSSRNNIFDDSPTNLRPMLNQMSHQVSFHSEVTALLEGEEDEDDERSCKSANICTTHSSSAPVVKVDESNAHKSALSWCSDGSLWLNGKKRRDEFGVSFLPLNKLSIVSVRVNRFEQTVSYYVDGQFVGVAFGPSGSGAVVEFELPKQELGCTDTDLNVYPAASISSVRQSIRLVASGSIGSVVVPYVLYLQQSMTSFLSRACGSLIAGDGNGLLSSSNERDISKWLSTPLFKNGIDPLFVDFVDKVEGNCIPNSPIKRWSILWDGSHDSSGSKSGAKFRRSSVDIKRMDFAMFLQEFASVNQEGQVKNRANVFMEWMNNTVDQALGPEPLSLRHALERTDSFSFNECEGMFVAALLKHSGLVDHAISIYSQLMASGRTDPGVRIPDSTSSMEEVWKAVRALRLYLRQKRQNLIANSIAVTKSDFDFTKDQFSSYFSDEIEGGYDDSTGILWTKQCNNCSSIGDTGACQYKVNILACGFNIFRKHVVVRVDINIPADSTNNSTHFLDTIKPLTGLWLNGTHIPQTFCSFRPLNRSVSSGYFVFACSELISSLYGNMPSADFVFQFGGRESNFSLCMLKLDLDGLENGDDVRSLQNPMETFTDVRRDICTRCRVLLSAQATSTMHSEFQSVTSNCFLFLTSSSFEGGLSEKLAGGKCIFQAMKMQEEKSMIRNFGLDALACILKLDGVKDDPMIVEELLLFLCPAFTPHTTDENNNRVVNLNQYNTGLEGCAQSFLESVHVAFWELYSVLDRLTTLYIRCWQGKGLGGTQCDINNGGHSNMVELGDKVNTVPSHILIRVILMLERTWAICFYEEKDYSKLYSMSFMSTLDQLMSFQSYEQCVNMWFKIAEEYTSFVAKSKQIDSGDTLSYLIDWKPFSANYINSGLAGQVLSCREILLHLCLRPSGLFTEEESNELGLFDSSTFEDLCGSIDMSTLSFMYEKMLSILRTKDELKRREAEKAEAERLAMVKEKERLDLECLVRAMVPLFDPTYMCDDGQLSDRQQVFEINLASSTKKSPRKINISRVGACLGQVEYDLSNIESVKRTGNYFEVTIIDIGIKDIGIGLAVKDKFPLVGEMPGWSSHSYGYHGDDGRKFGDSSTAGLWPSWMEGDIVGCGVIHETRDIFYTRNGALLGVAFAHISDTTLRPVVAFHSPHTIQKVKINFGLTSFVYKGDEVVTHPACLAERNRRQYSNQTSTLTSLQSPIFQNLKEIDMFLSCSDDESVHDFDEFADVDEEKEETNCLIESKYGDDDDNNNNNVDSNGNVDHSALPCKNNTSDSARVVKTFLELRKRLDLASIHLKELCHLRNFSWSLQRLYLASSCDVKVRSGAVESNTSTPQIQIFQRSRIAYIMKELRLGAEYVRYIYDGNTAQSASTGGNSSPCEGYIFTSLDQIPPLLSMCPLSAAPGNVLAFATLNEMDKAAADCSFRDESGKLVTPSNVSSLTSCIEAAEAEYFIGKHLFSLLALLPHLQTIKAEIANSSYGHLNLRALLILSRIGSTRSRRSASNILRVVLPQYSPDVAGQVLMPLVPLSDSLNCSDNNLFVSALVLSLCKSVVCTSVFDGSMHCAAASSSSKPWDSGMLLIQHADMDLELIRHLCIAPRWRESVLNILSELLSNAITSLKRYSTSEISIVSSLGEISALEVACVVCSVFTGLSTFYPGSKVRKKHNEIKEQVCDFGWVVNSTSRSFLHVAFPESCQVGYNSANKKSNTDHLAHIGLGKASNCLLDEMDKSQLTTAVEDVLFMNDMCGRSCLLTLLQLTNECLKWFRVIDRVSDSAVAPLLHRLTRTAVSACSLEMTRSSSVTINEISGLLVRDIALFPLPSSTSSVHSTLPSLDDSRIFCHARLLELHHSCSVTREDSERFPETEQGAKYFKESPYHHEGSYWTVNLKSDTTIGSSGDNSAVPESLHQAPFHEGRRDTSSYMYTSFNDSISCRYRDYGVGQDGSPTVDITGMGDNFVPTDTISSRFPFPATLNYLTSGTSEESKVEVGNQVGEHDAEVANENNYDRAALLVNSDVKDVTSKSLSFPSPMDYGRLVCRSDDIGNVDSLNDMTSAKSRSRVAGRLEKMVSPFTVPRKEDSSDVVSSSYVVTTYLDSELGVALYHSVPVEHTREVTRMYRRPLTITSYSDWLVEIDRSSTILHTRNMSEVMMLSGHGNTLFQNDDDHVTINEMKDKAILLLKLLRSPISLPSETEDGDREFRSFSQAIGSSFGVYFDLNSALLQEARLSIHALCESSLYVANRFTSFENPSFSNDHRSITRRSVIETASSTGIGSSTSTIVTEGEFDMTSMPIDDVSYVLEFGQNTDIKADGIMTLDVSLQGKKSLTTRFRKSSQFDHAIAMNNKSHSSKDPHNTTPASACCEIEHTLKPIIMNRSTVRVMSYRFTQKECEVNNDKDFNNWECKFRIRPLPKYLKCIVQRDFELILKFQLDEGTYNKCYFPRIVPENSGKSKDSTARNKRMLYFWRPRRVSGYKNLGDVITTVCRPPVGTVLVHIDYCKQIKKFWRVFTNTKYNYSVWRPIPASGHVCLGDIISIGKDTKPTLTSCASVPLWAVTECPLGEWVISSKKSSSLGMSANVWSVQNHLGYFLGGVKADDSKKMIKVLHKVAQKFASASKSASLPLVSSLGGYKLNTDVMQVLTGEWMSEDDIVQRKPSLSWTISVLNMLIETANIHQTPSMLHGQLLNSDLLILLFHHFLSVQAANNLKILPTIVKLLRLYRHHEHAFEVSGSLVENLCNVCTVVLLEALRKVKAQPNQTLVNSMIYLVELAAEICWNKSCRGQLLMPSVDHIHPVSSKFTCRALNSTEYRQKALLTSSRPVWSLNCLDFYKKLTVSDLIPPTPSHSNQASIPTCGHQLRMNFLDIVDTYRTLQNIYLKDKPQTEVLIDDLSSAYPLPRPLVMDSWFNNFRSCCCEESLHPYLAHGLEATKRNFQEKGYSYREEYIVEEGTQSTKVIIFSKTIPFANVSEVNLYIDSRSSLRKEDTLTITFRRASTSSLYESSNRSIVLNGQFCGQDSSKVGPITFGNGGTMNVSNNSTPHDGSMNNSDNSRNPAPAVRVSQHITSFLSSDSADVDGDSSPDILLENTTERRGRRSTSREMGMLEGSRQGEINGGSDTMMLNMPTQLRDGQGRVVISQQRQLQILQYNQQQLRQYALDTVNSLARARTTHIDDVNISLDDINQAFRSGILEIDRIGETTQLESFSSDDDENDSPDLSARGTVPSSRSGIETVVPQSTAGNSPPPPLRQEIDLMSDAELSIEFSMAIDQSRVTKGEINLWGWSFVASAVGEPCFKVNDKVNLDGTINDDISIETHRRLLDGLQCTHANIDVVCNEDPLPIDDDRFYSQDRNFDYCAAELYSVFASELAVDETTVPKFWTSRYNPQRRLIYQSHSEFSIPLNSFELTFFTDFLESTVQRGRLIATNKLGVPNAGGIFWHVDTPRQSHIVPDFRDVLRELSLKFGWSIGDSNSCKVSTESAVALERLYDNVFHVLHLCYYKGGGKLMLEMFRLMRVLNVSFDACIDYILHCLIRKN